MTVTLIAEAGVNHNGDLRLALDLVDAASEAGADIVKFQTFRAEEIATAAAAKADYQTRSTAATESQLAMLKRLELPRDSHVAVLERCRARRIGFLSTPFDLDSLRFLVEDMRVESIKISSGDLTNAPLLLATARSGRSVILSTGMATIDDVEAALGVLAFGYSAPAADAPSRDAFRRAFAAESGRAALQERVTLLHCTTEYPAPVGEANLRAMETLGRRFALPIGFSDHTPGIAVATAAAALGATMIEKHLTLDRTLPGPDHAASLDPLEFAALVDSVRAVGAALGDGVKRPSPSETKNVAIVRKSLVARHAIAEGEPFTAANITLKRPGTGIAPLRYWEMLGRRATRAYRADDLIED